MFEKTDDNVLTDHLLDSFRIKAQTNPIFFVILKGARNKTTTSQNKMIATNETFILRKSFNPKQMC